MAGFNPRSPRGGATPVTLTLYTTAHRFNPRSPRGGATSGRPCRPDPRAVSIHAPHEGERPGGIFRDCQRDYVSIHAPHEGERLVLIAQGIKAVRVSIHAPHEGERLGGYLRPFLHHLMFQSTLPTRGSDDRKGGGLADNIGVSIHAPHEGERRHTVLLSCSLYLVSIHAPHEGERQAIRPLFARARRFQSTLPTRGSDSRRHRGGGG